MNATENTYGVMIHSRFVLPSSKKFTDYLDYVDRREKRRKSVEPDYMNYQDYMSNEEKTTSLFTVTSDRLTGSEKKELKRNFSHAQGNGSVMWQDVITFDNKWLEEHGIYDSNADSLDEKKLKTITRLAMHTMLKKEGLDKSSLWSAAIHYNTDNIHVHVATVEPSPTRDRGKRKLKSIEAMKSAVINNVMDRSHEHKEINELIRERMVAAKKNDSTFSFSNRSFKKEFLAIYDALPADRREWRYGYNSLAHVKPQIDRLIANYIQKHHKDDFEELLKKLDQETEVLKRAYGNPERYSQYKQNKVDELYKRMGNAFFKEMKAYDESKQAKMQKERPRNNKRENLKTNLAFNRIKYGMDRMLASEYENWKNQLAFQKMEQEIERER